MVNGHHALLHAYAGSIISPTRILSAAHCIVLGTIYKIRAGSSTREGGQVVAVSQVINHPSFHIETDNNDISILMLTSALQMSKEVAVITLPKQNQPIADGTNLQVAGWGFISEEGRESRYLRAISVPVIGNELCGKMYFPAKIAESVMCAGFEEDGKGVCYGDSGGPLSDNRTLVGVVSWGRGCARRG